MDQKKYKELAVEQAKKYFKEMSPTALTSEPLIFAHFAGGIGEKNYDKLNTFAELSGLLEGALGEYNEANAVMDLVLFEDAMRHICRISRIIEAPNGHALLVGVGGIGKQSLAKLASFVAQYTIFQIVISATYGVNDLKGDLQSVYRRCGVKGEGISFLFTDSQITDERFLVFMNDLLSSGNIPGLFPPEDQDDIINNVRAAAKRAGVPDTRETVWQYFINQVRANLHVILCFSPIGEPIRVRARRFPSLVNCVVIDWFQPWPEEALQSVSKRFLGGEDLGSEEAKASVIGFMPYSFGSVNKASEEYRLAERRHNYTTPKTFLELIALYKAMLAARRDETTKAIDRYVSGVEKLKSTAEQVGGLEEDLKVKAVEVDEKKAQCDAMIPKLEAEKAKANKEAETANEIAAQATTKEAEVIEMKAYIEKDLEAAEPALVKAAAALDSLNKKDLGELKTLGKPPAGVDDVAAACIYMLHDGSKGKIDVEWKAAQKMMKDVNAFLEVLLGYKKRIDDGNVPKQNFKNLRPLLAKEHFTKEIMMGKSQAAAGLCDFVFNITTYWDINEDVEPKRLAAQSATQQLEKAIADKEAALAKKAEAEATVAELDRAVRSGGRREGRGRRGRGQLRAQARAREAADDGARLGGRALGDVDRRAAREPRAAAGRLAAGGGVRLVLGLLLEAVPRAAARRLLHAVPAGDARRVQGRRADVGGRRSDRPPHHRGGARRLVGGQPADRPPEVENGAIVCNCARWPLMIDPQLQGITWIKKKEEKNGVKVARLGQKELMPSIEAALQGGLPLVIENLGTTYDAVLAPVIGRQVSRRGRSQFVKLGDKEVDFDANFKLYLQTKLSNPHYPPEIQAETTLINFMVTEDGFEDQLLALTVSKERPDLEEQKADLISQQNQNKIKIKELEDGILQQLAEAEGDVTENITLIENLEDVEEAWRSTSPRRWRSRRRPREEHQHLRENRTATSRRAARSCSSCCPSSTRSTRSTTTPSTPSSSSSRPRSPKKERPTGTGNALLDMILPKKKPKG